jgi:hypothetical protein
MVYLEDTLNHFSCGSHTGCGYSNLTWRALEIRVRKNLFMTRRCCGGCHVGKYEVEKNSNPVTILVPLSSAGLCCKLYVIKKDLSSTSI